MEIGRNMNPLYSISYNLPRRIKKINPSNPSQNENTHQRKPYVYETKQSGKKYLHQKTDVLSGLKEKGELIDILA